MNKIGCLLTLPWLEEGVSSHFVHSISNFVYKDLGRRQLVTEDIRAGCARLLPLFRHRDALKIQVSPLRSHRHTLLLVGKVLTRDSKGCG